MMEHLRNFDWCDSTQPESFVIEQDLKNSATERILRSKFIDPLVSSDSENENSHPKLNWNEIFKRNNYGSDDPNFIYIPCRQPIPPYPKLSSLTIQQHVHCLKVISMQYPNVMPGKFIMKPSNFDYKIYEEVKSVYAKEQAEYIKWVKSLWPQHCGRAIQSKPEIDNVYDAEYKMKANSLQSFPKKYQMVAQIVLESSKHSNFEFIRKESLIKIDIKKLPQIELPGLTSKFTVFNYSTVPEPCPKHPYRFVLPGEKEMTIFPLTEVHRQLAQYAFDNGAQCVASESALKCIIETDQQWILPISVCEVIGADGDPSNVIVLGSDFFIDKPPAHTRAYKALRHMLELAFIPQSQKEPPERKTSNDSTKEAHVKLNESEAQLDDGGDSSDEDNLFIAEDDLQTKNVQAEDVMEVDNIVNKTIENTSVKDDTDFYKCTCIGTPFSSPPARSFRKWQVVNSANGDHYNVIVHCAHKAKINDEEVVLEPIPEYQLDFGGSRQSPDKLRSIALSLHLRDSATLCNVRIDCQSGEVATTESMPWEKFMAREQAESNAEARDGPIMPAVANRLYTTFDQLQGLLPGNYLLQHQTNHGPNGLLYAARGGRGTRQQLELEFLGPGPDPGAGAGTDPTYSPTLEPVLLPYHKARRILPCAFTPFEKQVRKEKVKKQPQKTPAMKPRRRSKRRK